MHSCVCSPWVLYMLRFPRVPESNGGDSGGAALPQQLWAVLDMHPEWAHAHCQCPVMFCWRAAIAAKAILCGLNTAVMDNPLQTVLGLFFFYMKVILKHHLSLIEVIHVPGRLVIILICLCYFCAFWWVSHLTFWNTYGVTSLSCNSIMVDWVDLGHPETRYLVKLSQIKFYQKTLYAEFLRVRWGGLQVKPDFKLRIPLAPLSVASQWFSCIYFCFCCPRPQGSHQTV